VILWSVGIWLFVRTFIAQSVYIHTGSMHQTLLEGDNILVNKLAYGPRLPVTLLSWPWQLQLPCIRIPGYTAVRRNDVIVFNLPMATDLPVDQHPQYVKRCVALPGDTLSIREGKIMINGKSIAENANVLYRYTVVTTGVPIDTSITAQLEGDDTGNRYAQNEFVFFLSEENADSIKHLKNVVSVEKDKTQPNAYSPKVYPNSSSVKWNIDNFGPLYIPKKGSTIKLDAVNRILYQKLIEQYEKDRITVRNDSAFINGKYTSDYIFKMNYYFAMGDNRYNSVDSRFWGLIPEDHLIGKASYILVSSSDAPLKKHRRSFSTVD
jgi:signal peptidase I